MKVSALIPTYNRRAQIVQAIESVLAQTVPVDEIIVVDDGSTDGTADAIRSQFGSRVIVLMQQNGGAAAARNRGIQEARGEWITFLDSDDVWLPTKIERQLEALGIFGDEFGLCFTDSVYGGNVNMKSSVFDETGINSEARFGAIDKPLTLLVAGWNPFVVQSLLVRRSLLRDIGGFDEALMIGEDTDLVFRLSFATRFCFVAEQLVVIDRDPSRVIGLCKLIATRDDRKYDSLERLYAKWLAMPAVVGTNYEPPIREMLRRTYYSSTAAKIHELRIGPAIRTIAGLRSLGDSYLLIISKLFYSKIKKLRRSQIDS